MKSGIERAHIKPDVRPQDDLFRHVNGRWLDEAEIPPDRAVHGAFRELYDKAEVNLRTIIEAAANAGEAADEDQRKIGDLYASFMAEDVIEQRGSKPIDEDLQAVDAITDTDSLVATMGRLQRDGVSGSFVVWVDTDALQSDRYIINLYQGGLGLPDESYYREETFADVRSAYVAHVGRMLDLAGIPDSNDKAQRIMTLETRLASAHWDRVASRDETKTYNKKDRADIEALTPGFDWAAWTDAFGAPPVAFADGVVRQPSYFTAMAQALTDVPLDDWKTWLAWKVVRSAAPYLSKAFVDENFAFYGTTLTGAPENRERWKRGVSVVEAAIGEALGRLYVAEHFPPAAKARMLELVANLVEAYRVDILALDWMSEETKQRALDKLEKFTPKIGYPDKWRDYSRLTIDRDDLVGNVRRAHAFELDRNLAKIGQEVDRTEWFMTPQTVNAYYNPGMNEIVFPAAILQPPFFDMEADDAANYGGIGAVIGHEIGHGFDDQGSKYDGDGNLKDWWTSEDRTEFEKRTQALITQYDAYEPRDLPGHKVNGALTVGENIGDLGGLTIAHKAYLIALNGGEAPVLEGLTGRRRLFYGWAQVWRAKMRQAEARRLLAIDPHSPPEFRCNGVLRNLDEFYAAFGVTERDALWLAPEQRIRIW
jgi:putative endopeptidase